MAGEIRQKGIARKLVLETGEEFYGSGFGAQCDRVCELAFNTSMAGYQKLLYDPANAGLLVIMAYTLIGSYGMADDDFEICRPSIGGLIVREYNDEPSNIAGKRTLGSVMEANGIPGIQGVDTRELVRLVRRAGSIRALITSAETPRDEAVARITATPVSDDLLPLVSCRNRWYYRTARNSSNVIIIDCGIKPEFIHSINERGCNVTVVPFDTSAEEIAAMQPDGIFISGGPGSPARAQAVVDTVRALKGRCPICGVGPGMLICALACGAQAVACGNGHRGCNIPVRDMRTGKIEITTQNHGWALDDGSIASSGLAVTHRAVMGNEIEGIESVRDRLFGTMFYPASLPDLGEADCIYDRFISMIKEGTCNA